jgi:predicted nucleic acid-binding protein
LTVLVDSNVLIDVVARNPLWLVWSESRLGEVDDGLVINPMIYAEVSMGFPTIALTDAALSELDLVYESIPQLAAFLAGRAYLEYRRRGGARRSPLPDFFIGAHAAVQGYTLLTRDPLRYRTYFPRLALIAPD